MLDWIYPHHAISRNLGFSWGKLPLSQTGTNFRLDLSISGNFQQLWVQLAENLPPWSQRGKQFRVDLSISGYIQQQWVQLAENPPHPEP